MDSWNQKIIPKPPEVSIFYYQKLLISIADETSKRIKSASCSNQTDLHSSKINLSPEQYLQNLNIMLQELNNNIEESLKYLKLENRALFAFKYQNGQFRTEKFTQIIKKIVKCMKNWEELNIEDLIFNFLQLFPSEDIFFKKVRLPTTKSFHFILLRLLGSFHLLMKTSSYCLHAASFLHLKIATGHFMAAATTVFAFVARIRVLCLDLASVIASSYDCMLPYIESLLKICAPGEFSQLPCNLMNKMEKIKSDQIIKDADFKKSKLGVHSSILNEKNYKSKKSKDELKNKMKSLDQSSGEKIECRASSTKDNICEQFYQTNNNNEDLGIFVSKEKFASINKKRKFVSEAAIKKKSRSIGLINFKNISSEANKDIGIMKVEIDSVFKRKNVKRPKKKLL